MNELEYRFYRIVAVKKNFSETQIKKEIELLKVALNLAHSFAEKSEIDKLIDEKSALLQGLGQGFNVSNDDSIGNYVFPENYICQKVRNTIEQQTHLGSYEIDSLISEISKCVNADSKYLHAILILKKGTSPEILEQACVKIAEACRMEPYNLIYKKMFEGLKRVLVDFYISQRNSSEEKAKVAENHLANLHHLL